MIVRYDGPCQAVDVPEAGLIVARGETVEVPDGLGARLVQQAVWTDPSAPVTDDPPDYTTWPADKLRAELSGRGLPSSGSRVVLAERLAEAARAADTGTNGTEGSDTR